MRGDGRRGDAVATVAAVSSCPSKLVQTNRPCQAAQTNSGASVMRYVLSSAHMSRDVFRARTVRFVTSTGLAG